MADNKSEQSKANKEEETSDNRKGLNKEAWTAISAIAVALIGGVVTIIAPIIPKFLEWLDKKPEITADAIANKWMSKAQMSSGQAFTIDLEIRQGCKVGEKCGTIGVLQVPCSGEIYLKEMLNDSYEFDVRNFDNRSSKQCSPGAGEHFKLLPDGKLSYKADWGIQGILNKTE